MYDHELVFEIINFEWNHVFTLFTKKCDEKFIFLKTNKALDILFTESLNKTLFYTNMVK